MQQIGTGRVWRVRAWIRVVAGVTLLGLVGIEIDVYRRAQLGETPGAEVWNGLVFVIVLGLAIGLLAFRPYLRVVDGYVEIRNVFKVTGFPCGDVEACKMTPYGLAFHLRGGQRPWTVVLQATMSIGEPRWFDVAEAVTGVRPELETYDCRDVDDDSARWRPEDED